MKQDPVQVQIERDHTVPMVRSLGGRWWGKTPVGELAFDNLTNSQYVVFNVHLLLAKHPCISFNSSFLRLC